MRAFALDGFGERGSVREVETPEPQEGQVLVRIRAASLNAFDVAVVNGSVKDYMEHRFPLIPGLDLSGVVEALGPGVDDVTVGEEVYGVSQKNFQGEGTFAQLVTTPAEAVSPKPASVDHAGASTLPVAALTALSAADAADPLEGQVVLVVGSTGGVGSFTTQLLANRGSHVVAVARSENADYARSLGASDTVDYTAGDLLESVRAHYRVGVDAVIDHTGDAVLVSSLAELVRPGGRVVSVAQGVDVDALAQRGITGANAGRASLERLPELAHLVDGGTLRIPATRVRPLDEAADALAEQATRHVRGKIVLQID